MPKKREKKAVSLNYSKSTRTGELKRFTTLSAANISLTLVSPSPPLTIGKNLREGHEASQKKKKTQKRMLTINK